MRLKNRKIAVLGCGWLGLPLAERLRKNGALVNGSTTEQEKVVEIREKGIQSYLIALDPNINTDYNPSFFSVDTLIVCIPPKRRDDIASFYPQQLAELGDLAKKAGVQEILFVSSTSVYPDINGEINEETTLRPTKPSGIALVEAEQLLMKEDAFETTVLRFGGLIGYDRHPGRFLQSKRALKNGNIPVNLIHQDDCIEIIINLLNRGLSTDIFNACSPEHPTRREFYTKAAKAGGYPMPTFSDAIANYKIVSSQKLCKAFDYRFRYKNPLDTI